MTFTSRVKLGIGWVKDSLELFKQHPAKWMGLSSLYLVFFQFLPILLLGIIESINKAHGSIFILFFVGALGVITVTPGGTDSLIQTFPPMTAPLPIVISPKIVASA